MTFNGTAGAKDRSAKGTSATADRAEYNGGSNDGCLMQPLPRRNIERSLPTLEGGLFAVFQRSANRPGISSAHGPSTTRRGLGQTL